MPSYPQLLTDLRLGLRQHELRPIYVVETEERTPPARTQPLADLATASGLDNLGQAVLLRVLTPRGELSALGHPEYGSRLHELIGQPNTETNRNLAKLFILESVKMEPRIEKVVRVTVEPAPSSPSLLRGEIIVKPIGETRTVAIGPFTLELQP